MVELAAASPLRRHADAGGGPARFASADLSLAEAPRGDLLLLTADLAQPDLRSAFEAVFGVAPPAPSRCVQAGPAQLLWQGPRDLLLMAPPHALAGPAAALAPALAGRPAALTDVGDLWSVIDISGPGAAHVLAGGTQVDLAAEAPALAMTRLAGLAVTLLFAAPGAYRLLVERSHADHLWRWLTR
jgi:heterotetrameric sarcosine oxidase gamma subunit